MVFKFMKIEKLNKNNDAIIVDRNNKAKIYK